VDVNLAVIIFLAAGSLAVLLTAMGVLLSRNVYQKLHFLSPAATIGVLAIVASIVVQEGFGQAGVKAMLAGAVLLIMNPILTHATARAARVREHGYWEEETPK
jgi:multicomponent Na+:H+ antiporter subunit G